MAEMAAPRYLCSQLVTLSHEEGAVIVNLEEIEPSGCVVESETQIPENADVEIRCGAAWFAGMVTQAEEHGYGWRVSVSFSPETPWKIGDFRPEHLLDLSELRAGEHPEASPDAAETT
jgi:hypothetical protein